MISRKQHPAMRVGKYYWLAMKTDVPTAIAAWEKDQLELADFRADLAALKLVAVKMPAAESYEERVVQLSHLRDLIRVERLEYGITVDRPCWYPSGAGEMTFKLQNTDPDNDERWERLARNCAGWTFWFTVACG